ncbi:hypothetical protein CGLO_08115 [Colletotrichum gloeosporioides Cg-14]|uniref:Uncharacterized protein n=1 Tax=Colletotrichum gloeosporioides (strain Cg-14) TaxID=1237896 RepID=T0K9Q6_COLGC|nr:hypothetical protein CGLO_08115 [Colletotrichum gloeosporioides Cg-14]
MKAALLTLTSLLALVSAMPQAEGGQPEQPQPQPQVPTTNVVVVTVTGQQPPPAETQPIPNVPAPVDPAPLPSTPVNPTAPVPTPPSPAVPPSGGKNCVCGATYCGKVLVGFQGYKTEELGQSYCATPNTNCASTAPSPESLEDTLFVCICDPGQEKGSVIELLCPCQGRCKNDKPDFIGRCETPCNLGCAAPAPGTTGVPVPEPVPMPVPVSQGLPADAAPPANKKARRF